MTNTRTKMARTVEKEGTVVAKIGTDLIAVNTMVHILVGDSDYHFYCPFSRIRSAKIIT